MQSRVDFIISHLKGRVLDVGCSACTLHGRIKEQVAEKDLYGIDIEIRKDSEHYKRASAEKIPFSAGFFGTVVAGELVEHLREPELFLREAARVLRKGGLLLLTTPNRASWLNRLAGTYNTPIHFSLQTRAGLQKLLGKSGFAVEEMLMLPYTAESSEGSKHKWFFSIRKVVHYLVPDSLREQCVVAAKKI